MQQPLVPTECTLQRSSLPTRNEKRLVWKFVTALKQCQDLERGKQLHLQVASLGCHMNKHVTTALIIMYSKCGYMEFAQEVFDKICTPPVIAWNCLILGYVDNGESSTALSLFARMSCERDSVSFLAALKACSSLAIKKTLVRKICLEKGSDIHKQLKECGFGAEVTLVNNLVDMYSKCGDMLKAREVFDGALNRNSVTWNSLMLGYVSNGKYMVALEMFGLMDCKPDAVTFLAGLKACAGLGAQRDSLKEFSLQRGRVIHKQLDDCGFRCTVLENTLMDMYSKCGCFGSAQAVFKKMKRKTVVSWNCMILGYVENREWSLALKLFSSMECQPDSVTFISALRACSGLAGEDKRNALEKGVAIHEGLKELDFVVYSAIGNTLLNMYCKCGCMQRARDVFERAIHRDTVTWNCLILGYVENGEYEVALEVFNAVSCEPDTVTFLAGLQACCGLAEGKSSDKQLCLSTGMSIHSRLKKLGLDFGSTSLTNTLMNMYMRCGAVEIARDVFEGMTNRDVVSWTCMILGYVENGKSSVGLEMFVRMDCEPDLGAYAAGLKACIGVRLEDSSLKVFCLDKGTEIHAQLRNQGLDLKMVTATKLVDLYCRCGSLLQAQEVFEEMEQRDAVAWTCLILGYAEGGESSQAFDLFMRMDCEPDSAVFVAILKTCGALTSLPLGLFVHAQVCKLGLEQDEKVSNSLIDFYGKCGKSALAEHVFLSSPLSDVVSWNALIAGYTTVGNLSRVFDVGAQMQEAGVEMNDVTFTCMLTACSHRGIVEKGKRCFGRMVSRGIRPSLEHYNCMVDMFGRSNMLDEALALVHEMPFEPDKVTWTSLLEASRKWNNVEVGKAAFAALSS